MGFYLGPFPMGFYLEPFSMVKLVWYLREKCCRSKCGLQINKFNLLMEYSYLEPYLYLMCCMSNDSKTAEPVGNDDVFIGLMHHVGYIC